MIFSERGGYHPRPRSENGGRLGRRFFEGITCRNQVLVDDRLRCLGGRVHDECMDDFAEGFGGDVGGGGGDNQLEIVAGGSESESVNMDAILRETFDGGF